MMRIDCRRIINTAAAAIISFCLLLPAMIIGIAIHAGMIQGMITPAYATPAQHAPDPDPCLYFDSCTLSAFDFTRIDDRR